jgi:type VI protein secretion system component VasK
VSREILAAKLVVAQQHGPGGAAHLVLLAVVAVVALVVIGVNRWRARHDAAAAKEQSSADDRSAEHPRSSEDE